MSDIDFGELVKEHRLALRLSISDLAARVDRSEATVKSWERGDSRPTADSVFTALSDAIKVDETELRAAAGQELPEPREKTPPSRRPIRSTPPTHLPSNRDDRREMISYWIRSALTAVALIALVVILIWAVSGLADQVGGLFEE